jgi:hypothetical protein
MLRSTLTIRRSIGAVAGRFVVTTPKREAVRSMVLAAAAVEQLGGAPRSPRADRGRR